MIVLYLHAGSGRARWLTMPPSVNHIGQFAAMMRCTEQAIEVTFLDDEHLLFQCTAYPEVQNRAFYYKDLDACRVGGDAAVARIDGGDVAFDYKLPPLHVAHAFQYGELLEEAVHEFLENAAHEFD